MAIVIFLIPNGFDNILSKEMNPVHDVISEDSW
jgi:hypothetical protein